MAFRFTLDDCRQFGRKIVRRAARVEILRQVLDTEQPESNIFTLVVRLHFEFVVLQRMFLDLHFLRTKRSDEQKPLPVDALAK